MTTEEIRTALLNILDRWVDASLFGKNPKYLHAVIINDDECMLEVAKQMALLAHFPSFDENNPDTCTRVSILGGEGDSYNKKAIFGNLLVENDEWIHVPLDVKVEYVPLDLSKKSVVNDWVSASNSESRYHQVVIDKSELIRALNAPKANIPNEQEREELAKRANAVYVASQMFDIIRAEDANNVHEFDIPVQSFLSISKEEVEASWVDIKDPLLEESNRCLADSLCVRWRSLEEMRTVDESIMDTLINHLPEMSQSEHARWNVEKLINGYRPYTYSEVIDDENLSGDARKKRINYLKKNKAIQAHIDLCSYSRLRRIDLESIKYDSFLLLAMLKYWEDNLRKSVH